MKLPRDEADCADDSSRPAILILFIIRIALHVSWVVLV